MLDARLYFRVGKKCLNPSDARELRGSGGKFRSCRFLHLRVSTRAYRVFHRSSPNLDGALTHRSELVSTFWKRFQHRATRNSIRVHGSYAQRTTLECPLSPASPPSWPGQTPVRLARGSGPSRLKVKANICEDGSATVVFSGSTARILASPAPHRLSPGASTGVKNSFRFGELFTSSKSF